MINTQSLYRPGLTAIAAVLALSSTSVIAQVTLPQTDAPATASAAPTVAPAPVAQSAPVQTVQSVPVAPKLPEIAATETPAPASSTRQQAAARPRVAQAEPSAPRQVALPSNRVSTSSPAAAVASPPKAVESTPQTSRVSPAAATPAVQTPVNEPTAVDQTSADVTESNDMGYASWVLLGGGLLIVAGGAAFALGRRPKRRNEDVATYEVPVESVREAQPVTQVVAARVPSEPRREAVQAPSQSIGNRTFDDRQAQLEAMIAEAPTEANPFHSRRNRLRRADFLLRTGQVQEQGFAPAQQTYEEPALASDRWSETRFGGRQNTRVSWKPVTNR